MKSIRGSAPLAQRALATSFDEFRRYFESGQGQLWERQALCKARVIYGAADAARKALEAINAAAFDPPWREENVAEIHKMRLRLQETAKPANLKRGIGGIVDVEFLVQMLQLKHGRDCPQIRVPGTFEALDALHQAGLLAADDYRYFHDSYRTMRSIIGRLQLMTTTAGHDLPTDPIELAKLARLLNYSDAGKLLADCERYRLETRRRFEQLCGAG